MFITVNIIWSSDINLTVPNIVFFQKLFSEFLRDVLDPDQNLGCNIVKELQRVHDCIQRHHETNEQHSIFADPDMPTPKPSALDFVTGNQDLPENGNRSH